MENNVKYWVPILANPGKDYLYAVNNNQETRDILIGCINVLENGYITYYYYKKQDIAKYVCSSEHINTGVSINGWYYFTDKKLRREHMKKMLEFEDLN